ncbi:MAG: diacylglycerol kinase family protein [Myxococcota bacterium]
MSEPSPEKKPDRWAQRGFFASFGYALNGVLRTVATQRNMKMHWVSAEAVMLVGMALELDIAARASVMVCVGLVLCMEVLNTALEAFVDLHIKQYERAAMVAKDAAAAAVLIFAAAAVVVFADILFHRWRSVMRSTAAIVRTIQAGVPILIALGYVLWAKRRVWLFAGMVFVATGLLAYLAYWSRDEVFTAGALAFLFTGFWARVRENALVV